MNAPLVSILVPCYNHQDFLDDCLQSILDQDYPRIELLICDDCSPDRSYEIISSYKARLEQKLCRVVILRNESNCGVTKNLNRLLALAQGSYIKIIASDDAMAPNAIGTMVAYMEEHPECGVAVSNGIKVGEDQHYPNFHSIDDVYTQVPDFSTNGFLVRMARCNPVFAPGAMVRKSIYDAYGFYDESIAVEDLEYWLRLLSRGSVTFGYIPQQLIFYRINGNSMSSQSVNAQLQKRRERMHSASMAIFTKYQASFPRGAYEEVCLLRILEEWGFALEQGLTQWASQLQKQWQHFPNKTHLSLKNYLYLHGRCLKMRLKYTLKNIK